MSRLAKDVVFFFFFFKKFLPVERPIFGMLENQQTQQAIFPTVTDLHIVPPPLPFFKTSIINLCIHNLEHNLSKNGQGSSQEEDTGVEAQPRSSPRLPSWLREG